MVKKSVGFDLENESARTVAPSRVGDATAMIVVSRRRPEYGEAPEAVVTLEVDSRRIQSAPVQGLPECQLVPTTKRRVCFLIRADVVTIPPADCTVPRVKLGPHLRRSRDPHVAWKNRVERAPQFLTVAPPPFWYPNTNRLPASVHPRVGASRPQRGHRSGAKPLECLFQNSLYGALLRLALPPAEPGAVIVQYELHGALGHCSKPTGAEKCVKQQHGGRRRRKPLTLHKL